MTTLAATEGETVRGWLLAVILGVVLLPACAVRTTQHAVVVPAASGAAGEQEFHGTRLERPLRMPAETVTDTTGQPYNLRTTPSQPLRLVYLGYLDCPNICTTMLSDVAAGLQRLDPAVRPDIEFLFIDIRPDHDDPDRLRRGLTRFDPEFTGLLGSPAQVERIAGQLGVVIREDDDHGLLHSARVVGFDRNNRGTIVWGPGITPDQFARDLTRLTAAYR